MLHKFSACSRRSLMNFLRSLSSITKFLSKWLIFLTCRRLGRRLPLNSLSSNEKVRFSLVVSASSTQGVYLSSGRPEIFFFIIGRSMRLLSWVPVWLFCYKTASWGSPNDFIKFSTGIYTVLGMLFSFPLQHLFIIISRNWAIFEAFGGLNPP